MRVIVPTLSTAGALLVAAMAGVAATTPPAVQPPRAASAAATVAASASPPMVAASAAAASTLSRPASAGGDKDIVLDAPAAASGPRARPAETGNPPAAARAGAAAAPSIYTTAAHDAAIAAALGDFGLALLQQQSRQSGRADTNAVVSPLSVTAALGMVHAGASGDTAREIATLLSTGPAGQQGFTTRLPSVLARLRGSAADAGPLSMASRVWVRSDVVPAIPAPYASVLRSRYASDGAAIALADPEAARRTVNQWTAEHTRQRITQLLPAGSLTPSTKLVVTNAVHFRSLWAEPFDPKATSPRTFHAPGGDKSVPTMVDERVVRRGTIDNLDVIELPFAGRTYALMVATVPAGHTLNALETDLTGLDIAAWSAGLKDTTCRLELPKFAIDAAAASLKPALREMGVRTVFTDAADLQPMLGRAAAGTSLDDVLHAATIVIDERGGEASAATAATVQAKSFAPPAEACAVDRPFVFAIVHKPTGAPVFLGKVADPSAAPATPVAGAK